MDIRYKPIVDEVISQMRLQLGSRLKSAFIKGSVARGDALWGVSDLDLVLAFAEPTSADSDLKRELETSINGKLGQDVLIIQRIWTDRLEAYDEGTRAYSLYSCRHDIELIYGDLPASFLPEPPVGQTLVRLIAPIIYRDGAPYIKESQWTRHDIRLVSKRMLQALALPAIAAGQHEFMAPLKAAEQSYSPEIDALLPFLKTAYLEAPSATNLDQLRDLWNLSWQYLIETDLIPPQQI